MYPMSEIHDLIVLYSLQYAAYLYTDVALVSYDKMHLLNGTMKKIRGCLGYIRDHATQFIWGLFHKPFQGSRN